MQTITFGKTVVMLSAILGLVFAAPGLQADDKEHKDHAGKQGPEKFLKEAMEANQLEVKAAEMVQQKAQNPEVKQLAATMAEHHRQMGQQLEELAQQHNIQASTQLTGKHQQQWSKLQGKSGEQLDKAYVTFVVKDHKRDVKMLEKCSEEFTSAPELKAFIDRSLPKVREHLEMAQNTAQELNIPQSELAADMEEEADSAVGAPGSQERGIGEETQPEPQPDNESTSEPEIDVDASVQPDNERP